MDVADSSALKCSTVIRFHLPERRSAHLTPPAPVPTDDKADEMILQDTLQVSLAEHNSQEEQEARKNVDLVNENLIEKIVEGSKNVIDDSSTLRNDDTNIPGTRLEPRSDKESPEVEINDKQEEVTNNKEEKNNDDIEVEITNVVIPVNVNEEEDEITNEVYELKRREKGKIVEESRSTPTPTPIRSPRIHTDLVFSDTKKLQELTVTDLKTSPSSSSPSINLSKTNRLISLIKAKPAHFKRYKSFFQELWERYGYLFGHLKTRFMLRKSFDTLADHLQEVMVESLPTIVDKHIKEQVQKKVPDQAQISSQIENAIANVVPSQVDASVRNQQYQLYLAMKADPQLQQKDIAIWLALQMKFERLFVPHTTCRTSIIRIRDQDDPHDDANLEGENSAKQYKTSKYQAYVSREPSSGQVNKEEPGPSTSVSQDVMEEVSLTIDETKLNKMADEMLRQICTLGDEHQYHIDQMKNFLKSDIVWKFITTIVARRANDRMVSIIEPDYKNLNKNDIEDIYLLIMNGKKVNLTAPTISFPGIEKHKMFSIIYEPVHGIIYKNSKEEKKYGYVQRELTNDEVEYLKLFEEEIEVRLKYRNQMRRWEMYVNRRPLGPRRERPE
ncbi:hypothetical protein Tco_0031212 [Tanacetum coccineum]